MFLCTGKPPSKDALALAPTHQKRPQKLSFEPACLRGIGNDGSQRRGTNGGRLSFSLPPRSPSRSIPPIFPCLFSLLSPNWLWISASHTRAHAMLYELARFFFIFVFFLHARHLQESTKTLAGLVCLCGRASNARTRPRKEVNSGGVCGLCFLEIS